MQTQSITSTCSYSQTSEKAFYLICRHFRAKKVCPKVVIPPLMNEILRNQKFSGTPEGSPTKFLRHCDTKNLFKFPDIPIVYRIFRYEKLQNKKGHFTDFFYDWKSFRHLFCDTPSMVYQKFCVRQMVNARNFQKHLEIFIDKKIRAKIVIPPYV